MKKKRMAVLAEVKFTKNEFNTYNFLNLRKIFNIKFLNIINITKNYKLENL